MNQSIHIDDALKKIWTGDHACALEYFKANGSRGSKSICIHPTNKNQHFAKNLPSRDPGSRPQNIHIKGNHLIKMMDLTDGHVFFLSIPLLIKYNGQKIRHQKEI